MWKWTLIHTYKVVCGKLKRNDPPQFWKDKIADKKRSYCCNVIDRWRGILIVPYCVPGYYVVCWSLRRAKKIRFHPNIDAAMVERRGDRGGLSGFPFLAPLLMIWWASDKVKIHFFFFRQDFSSFFFSQFCKSIK